MTTHVNYIKRELLTPDEVRRLSPPKKEGDRVVAPGDLLVFLRGRYPIRGRQMFYFLDPEFWQRSQLPELTQWPVLS
jgi:type IV secretion system protein VirD4